MSNGIFNTSRQLSVEERIQALVAQKANRTSARASLMEAAEATEARVVLENELAKIDSDQKKDAAKEDRLNDMQEAMFVTNRKHDLMTLENRLFQEGQQMLWNKLLFETVYTANWVDDLVKPQIIQPMYESFASTMEFLKETIPFAFTKNPTRLLEAFDTVVTETAKKAAKRITEETEHDPNAQPNRIQFNLNQDEEDDFDQSISDLNADEIAKKVKDKVLTVVQDEKKASKDKAETMKEIDDVKKDEDESSDDDDESDGKKSKSKKKEDGDDESEDANSESTSDEGDEDNSASGDSKSKSKGKSKDSSDDDDLDDDDDSDDKESKSKKKKDGATKSKEDNKDSSDDDDDVNVTEGVLGDPAPDDFYKVVSTLFTNIEKKSGGNDSHNSTIHITKAGRVDITNYKMVRNTGKKKFSRVLDLTPDDAMKVAKSCGFKRGSGKLLKPGIFMIKKINGGGFAEINICDGYKAEYDGMGVGAGGASYGDSYGGYSSSTVYMKYLKQSKITIKYIGSTTKSIRERYLIESGIVYGKSDWEVALEQRVAEKNLRTLNNSIGSSVFESIMMASRIDVASDAVVENVQLEPKMLGDATLMEAITRYTVLETLNTLGIIHMSTDAAIALRKAYVAEVANQNGTTNDPKIMSVDTMGGTKSTRINTQKFKRNNDRKVMSSGMI